MPKFVVTCTRQKSVRYAVEEFTQVVVEAANSDLARKGTERLLEDEPESLGDLWREDDSKIVGSDFLESGVESVEEVGDHCLTDFDFTEPATPPPASDARA